MSREIGVFRLGTRGSRLALVQAENAKEMISSRYPGLDVEIVKITTSGDKGDRFRLGAFVREIQEAVLDGRVDCGLHCLKDLPTADVPGLAYAAYLEREDAHDLLISRGPSLSELPPDSLVGTGSIRRTGQLASVRPDLRFSPLVGNVDTRLRKLAEGEYDAIVLARAGLNRLGLLPPSTASGGGSVNEVNWGGGDASYLLKCHDLAFATMLPAPGQGVLVLETREDDQQLLSVFDHAPTRNDALAERAFLHSFGGGCSVPVAAYASLENLWGRVTSRDGAQCYEAQATGSDPIALGQELAERIGEQGGFAVVRAALEAARLGEP